MGVYAVTGAASGIGSAVCDVLRGAGHEAITVDQRDSDIVADLSTSEGVAQAVAGVRARAMDGLDGFVPCAGVGPTVEPVKLARINYYAVIDTTDGLRELLAKRGGRVVLISSNSAPMDFKNEELAVALLEGEREAAEALAISSHKVLSAVYGATKRALVRWMRHHCAAWARDGICINAVAPGMTRTPLVTNDMDSNEELGKALRNFEQSIPLRCMAEPSQIASAVDFLLDAGRSGYCCGSLLFVDGGIDAQSRPNDF